MRKRTDGKPSFCREWEVKQWISLSKAWKKDKAFFLGHGRKTDNSFLGHGRKTNHSFLGYGRKMNYFFLGHKSKKHPLLWYLKKDVTSLFPKVWKEKQIALCRVWKEKGANHLFPWLWGKGNNLLFSKVLKKTGNSVTFFYIAEVRVTNGRKSKKSSFSSQEMNGNKSPYARHGRMSI